ncbi:MAG TPA: sensor histidine kinase [Caldimonas sp.]|nr:sensor histidine kinase [Caldimonas sp.]
MDSSPAAGPSAALAWLILIAMVAVIVVALRRSPQATAEIAAGVRRSFIAYARWLDSISWKRFAVLSLLALIASGILSSLPPFSTEFGGQTVTEIVKAPRTPAPPVPGRKRSHLPVDITVDKSGVHIVPHSSSAPAAAGAASTPGSAPAASAPDASRQPGVHIVLPPGADSDEIREAIENAKSAIEDAKGGADDAQAASDDEGTETRVRTRHVGGHSIGENIPPLVSLLIVLSIVTKVMARGRFRAEAKAVASAEAADAEALKRQVLEARVAAMQAQVEPHFLFNTLASIDHLIETDPQRASQMQKNLIALLRASMPAMRESHPQTHSLGREMAVIRPYLEILKVRMEDRLETAIDVPDGLLSAEFPPMMIQSLVENAIKHGLEPKPEGGRIAVKAEIVHGDLAVTVADTGLGFGKAATAGTGTGLANIRERLKLLYGDRATMVVSENAPTGTVVTLTVPYQVQPFPRPAATT